MAFPVERERWTNYGFTPTRLKSVLTASDGRFTVDDLPPGAYFLLAVPAAQERAWIDPVFLAAHAAQALRVSIDAPGATVDDVVLSLIR